MKARVVYDSFFGNTEKIAQAIAQAIGEVLGSQEEVEVLRVGEVSPGPWAGVALLVVGSPTRAFSATPETKKFLGSIPMDPRISADSDKGTPFIIRHPDSLASQAFGEIIEKIEEKVKEG